MRSFSDLSIHHKLLVSFVLTIAIALTLAGAGVVAADAYYTYTNLVRDLDTFVQIIAENSGASLAFEDPQSASETLGALRARANVVSACLYRVDRSILASYRRGSEGAECAPPADSNETLTTLSDITISRPITLQNRRIGTLVLLYDLGEVYASVGQSLATVLLVLLLASSLAYLVSSQLRARIVAPILQLVQTSTLVSNTRDYSVRAAEGSADEIGMLSRTFNEMLASIQSRDAELRQAIAMQSETLARLARLNEDLNRSNKELARSNEDLERFAFIASHDLQEPLRMVSLHSELLLATWPGPLEGNASAYASRIIAGTKRMRELLTDLLAYAELAGAREIEMHPINLNRLLQDVQEGLRLTIEETGAAIVVEPLPVITAYDTHFTLLFQNLLSNALKYRGEAAPRVDIRAKKLDGVVEFSVSDNGLGIDPEYHQKIFMAFTRLHGPNIPGTGIGLAVCQRVVERYGGRIWVDSRLGHGSTFHFTVPIPRQTKA